MRPPDEAARIDQGLNGTQVCTRRFWTPFEWQTT
jgi:hypothetical protein